jgi:hypothetical protein
MPGERAISEKRRQLSGGLEVDEGLLDRIAALAEKQDVSAFRDHVSQN